MMLLLVFTIYNKRLSISVSFCQVWRIRRLIKSNFSVVRFLIWWLRTGRSSRTEKPKTFDVIRMFYKTWPTEGENMTSRYTEKERKASRRLFSGRWSHRKVQCNSCVLNISGLKMCHVLTQSNCGSHILSDLRNPYLVLNYLHNLGGIDSSSTKKLAFQDVSVPPLRNLVSRIIILKPSHY